MTTMNSKNIFIGLAIVLAVILIFNIAVTINIDKNLKKSTEEQKEKLRPGKIELTAVKNSKCADCFDISPILSNIKNSKANISKEIILEFDSKEGKEILSKYKIQKLTKSMFKAWKRMKMLCCLQSLAPLTLML